jgi:hypothetical protein
MSQEKKKMKNRASKYGGVPPAKKIGLLILNVTGCQRVYSSEGQLNMVNWDKVLLILF